MPSPIQSVYPSWSTLRDALRASRWQRLLRWLLGGWLLFLLIAFLLAPPLLSSVLEKQLTQALQREVTIARLAINPLALSMTVGGLVVTRDGVEQAGFDELYVNLSAASLLRLAVVADEIRLQRPRLAFARIDEGRYDVSDLLDGWLQAEPGDDGSLPRFSLNNIQIQDARVLFDDRPRERIFDISDVQLALPFLSSLPYQADILVQPLLSANVNGSVFRLEGQTTPFADGRESELRLDLAGFDLSQLQPYLPAGLPLRLHSARLDSQLKAVFRELSGGVNSLIFVGDARVADLRVAQADGQPLLAWKSLAVVLDEIDPFNRRFAIKRITLDGPQIDLSVSPGGVLNWQQLQAPSVATQEEDAVSSANSASWSLAEFELADAVLRWRDLSNSQPVTGELRQWAVRMGPVDSSMTQIEIAQLGGQLDFGDDLQVDQLELQRIRIDLAARLIEIDALSNSGSRLLVRRDGRGELAWLTPPALKQTGGSTAQAAPWFARVNQLLVDDLNLSFEDRSIEPAVVQQIEGLSLRGERLGNVPNEKGTLALQARVNRQGSLAVKGDMQLDPFVSNLKIEGRAIPLASLQAYAGEFLNAQLQQGLFSAKGDAALRLDRGRLLAAYKGSATLGNLLLVDPENKADFLKWRSLHVGGIDFRLSPMRIDIREIALSDFYSRLVLNEAGRLNLADIVRRQQAEESLGDTPKAEVPVIPVKIAKVTLNNGTVNFTDRFVRPNYAVDVGKLGGRISGLSSTEGSVAELELRGNYGAGAPVLIQGQLNPLATKSFLDLKAEVSDVDLTGFSPYSGKYAGYAIDRGKLSLNLAYRLENQQLSAENRLFLDQLTLGERVESPDATKLPVSLAIALLRNNRGEIDLNLPISGSLDDPQFSLGGIIVKVIVNLFVKAVTSPFALIGSMFGGGEELSSLAFAPGQVELDAQALAKLETLARALKERSGLKLDITGHADPESDREGLKRRGLEKAMMAEKLADLRKQGKTDEGVRIEADDYPRYLALAYKAAKFPKPRNFVGMQKDLPLAEMEQLMLANQSAGDEDLRQLARDRAVGVQSWLIEQGGVAAGQLFLVPPKPETPVEAGGRVEFTLR